MNERAARLCARREATSPRYQTTARTMTATLASATGHEKMLML